MASLTPLLQSLMLEQAATFMLDTREQLALLGTDPIAFYRWAADRQLADARKFANAARQEATGKCGRCSKTGPVSKYGPYTVCDPCRALMDA